MKKTVAILIAVLSLASCKFISVSPDAKNIFKEVVTGTGETVTVNHDMLTGFNGIRVNGSFDVKYSQTDAYSVSVTAKESLHESIVLSVADGILTLSTKDKVQIADDVDVEICGPDLTSITVNGSGDMEIPGPVSVDNAIDVTINGAGDVEVNKVCCADMSVSINGAGDLDLEGINCGNLAVKINGAGDVDISGMDVRDFRITISGAGDAKVSGKADTADINISGAGEIDARGLQCSSVRKKASGISSIKM